MKPRRFVPRGLAPDRARPAEKAWPARFLRILKALAQEPLGARRKLKPVAG